MKQGDIYLRMFHRIQVCLGDNVTVGDVAVIANKENHTSIASLPLHTISSSDKNIVIIDVMQLIERIYEHNPELTIQSIGPPETIVIVKQARQPLMPIYFILVWLLLFIGAALAVMNFHEDVSMGIVHQRIFQLVTSNEEAKPLLLQIPYSIGLGLGMILFFNHFFQKRLSDEPSPLEIEMFNYQQALDEYVIRKENKEKYSEDHAD